jgi:hypothetical protein
MDATRIPKKPQGNKSGREHEWVAPGESLSHLNQAKWMRQHIPEARVAARVDSLPAMADARATIWA